MSKNIFTTITEFNNNEVITFLEKQLNNDKKEYKGHIPSLYNKGEEWNDNSWIVTELFQFLNKSYDVSYTLMEFGKKYDYGTLNSILKQYYKKEYNNVLNSHTLNENAQDEYFYHGTSNYGFDNFNLHEVNYFTKNYDYAAKYIKPSYSALRSGKPDGEKGIYTVKLNCEKIFDTKNNIQHQKIFLDYTNNYGNMTPLAESGYPDWSDAENLAEYFEKKRYKFDCIIIQDAFEHIAYATIGKNKVTIIDSHKL